MDEKTSSFSDRIYFDLINIIEESNLVEIFYASLNNIWIKVHFIFIANTISLRDQLFICDSSYTLVLCWFEEHTNF